MRPLSEVLGADLSSGCDAPKLPGVFVAIGRNAGPVFEIVHVSGGLAWVRPVANGQEGLVALERLRVV